MLLAQANPLNGSELIFPTIECFHIVGFATLIGTIAVLDFRLLGLGLMRGTIQELAKELAPWTLAGLVIVLISGPAMFSSDPDMYYLNTAFQIKMVLVVLAIVFHYTIHRKAVRAGAPPGQAKLVACISLALWVGVIAGGIFIGFAGNGFAE